MHRIALQTLLFHRAKVAAALAGVAFATALMIIQIGLYEGLRSRASVLVNRLGGDLWIMAAGTSMVDDSELLATGAELPARAHPCVTSVRPAIVAWVPYRTPAGARHTLQLVGSDLRTAGPTHAYVPWSFAEGLPQDLLAQDRVAIDDGDLSRLGLAPPLVGSTLEIAERRVEVRGVTTGIRNVSLIPMVFADVETARTLAGAAPDGATYWLVDLADGSCGPSVARAIERDPRLDVMTREELASVTEEHVVTESGAGAALAFVALLGLVVGTVIVGQTLLSLVREHHKELGMLRAVGASRSELAQFVAWLSAFVAAMGGALGVILALLVQSGLGGRSVELHYGPGAILTGLAAVLVMCTVAGAASLASVLRLDVVKVLQ
ncbi:MAG: ABC transporter permease [Sandaracinaceae bacterium]|nr:ABC transporter permease [Sandaracinaceae bacterium]